MRGGSAQPSGLHALCPLLPQILPGLGPPQAARREGCPLALEPPWGTSALAHGGIPNSMTLHPTAVPLRTLLPPCHCPVLELLVAVYWLPDVNSLALMGTGFQIEVGRQNPMATPLPLPVHTQDLPATQGKGCDAPGQEQAPGAAAVAMVSKRTSLSWKR